jgi:PAS domain S-box-containing protein
MTALREYAAAARTEATAAHESATAARKANVADERRIGELATGLEALRATLAEFKHGFDEARSTAAVAKREAEAARSAAERVGQVNEASHEKFTEVWKEMLTAGRPPANGSGAPRARVSVPKREAPPARKQREGFDDQTRPMAVLDLKGKFKELNPAFSKLVGYQEHEFGKATWPSVLDRAVYKEQMEELGKLLSGELESVEVQSTYMHGQGLMVPIVGSMRLVRDDAGEADSLLLVAEDRQTS